MSNCWKTIKNHISASDVKFYPKGATSQKPKESTAHHFGWKFRLFVLKFCHLYRNTVLCSPICRFQSSVCFNDWNVDVYVNVSLSCSFFLYYFTQLILSYPPHLVILRIQLKQKTHDGRLHVTQLFGDNLFNLFSLQIIFHQIKNLTVALKIERLSSNQSPPKTKITACVPEGRHNLPARAGNFYLKLMFFLLFSCIFPLILMQTFIFKNFSKMSIFCIFLLRSTLKWSWTFGGCIFIFL